MEDPREPRLRTSGTWSKTRTCVPQPVVDRLRTQCSSITTGHKITALDPGRISVRGASDVQVHPPGSDQAMNIILHNSAWEECPQNGFPPIHEDLARVLTVVEVRSMDETRKHEVGDPEWTVARVLERPDVAVIGSSCAVVAPVDIVRFGWSKNRTKKSARALPAYVILAVFVSSDVDPSVKTAADTLRGCNVPFLPGEETQQVLQGATVEAGPKRRTSRVSGSPRVRGRQLVRWDNPLGRETLLFQARQ